MKMIILKMILITSIMKIFMNTPMSLGLLLLIQTMFIMLMMNKMIYCSWFIMITFLMMVGGILILFTYMSSIASNEKFKFNFKIMLLSTLLMTISDEILIENQPKENQEFNLEKFDKLSMSKMYSKTYMIMILMVLYLLLTMISVSKLVKIQEGPLRSKNYE
uniref:NADH dehydrogenase subunit 6 n=1 Tax=Nandigallia matai TaxID=1792639 RepID=UPI0030029722|nr:NADH dehydrogenase subunit 6 [Nandigallia matai]